MSTEIKTEKVKVRNQVFHDGPTQFRFLGGRRGWEFTAPTPDKKTYTLVTALRGGYEVAQRVAALFGKDVTKTGRLGGQRANINRLIEAAR